MSDATSARYDIVAVGTGFSTTAFLHRVLRNTPVPLRILVLEAGPTVSHAARLAEGDPRRADARTRATAGSQLDNRTPRKQWNFFSGLGGSSNVWYACTPRMLPDDFELHSRYGVGVDWPLSYDDLEPYYCDAEELLSISGSSAPESAWPMSRPYPQPPHAYSAAGELFKRAFPDRFFPQATARPRVVSSGGRSACCASNHCGLCPVDAKLTVTNALASLYRRPEVELLTGATVTRFDHADSSVRSVTYRTPDGERTVATGLLVLGANAIFNPQIMLASGLDDSQLGRGLVESVSCPVSVELERFHNFQGSTIVAGQGFMLATGPHRSDRAAALLHLDNRLRITAERGRWLSRMQLVFTFEDLRQDRNRVAAPRPGRERPTVRYEGRSDYCERGIRHLPADVERLLTALDTPVRDFEVGPPLSTDSHIQGTHVMGTDPKTSVVDSHGVHHRLRNLIPLGGGLFPTAPAANPTLTIAALALRTADHLMAPRNR